MNDQATNQSALERSDMPRAAFREKRREGDESEEIRIDTDELHNGCGRNWLNSVAGVKASVE